MAKRRKVSAPSSEDLDRIEAQFRGETVNRAGGAMAPIAQVARQSAEASDPLPPEARAAQARDRSDAERLRAAEAGGLVMVDLPLEQIDDGVIVRDRTILDPAEMEELKRSIIVHGLRLPIEVFDLAPDGGPDGGPDGTGAGTGQGGGARYGLISGYRRLRAVRELNAQYGDRPTIRAIRRDPDELGGAMVAMVEENEVRAQLSHFERGRIAAVSADQGVFGTVEEAVNALFTTASKAKRSKIRSFALIYEELGDLLDHAEALKEKDGLRLATALRQGGEGRLREALEDRPAQDAAEEWARLEAVIREYEAEVNPAPRRAGGRPKQRRTAWTGPDRLTLSNGIEIHHSSEGGDHVLRLSGKKLDIELVSAAMEQLARMLEKPK